MKNNVEVDEKVIIECSPHWSMLIVPAIISLVFVLSSFKGIFSSENRGSGFVCILIAALVFFIPFLLVKNNKLVLTDKRIFGKTGIIKTKSLSSPISKIQTVNIDRNALGRILGYSDLTIHCITGVYVFRLSNSNAQDMQNSILNEMK